ncbi:MAG: SPOR domain-containing protein [Pseudomonadota bacterium]
MTTTLPLKLCAIGAVLSLGACDANGNFQFPTLPGAQAAAPEVTRASGATKLVERDVEAPEIFQVSEAGLWDGRPSLGGVWVAHPDVGEPERVLIRNETTDKFVIGALFRKERETPGPKLQISSDAAAALGVIAGSPVRLTVTALRKEEVEEVADVAPGAQIMPAAAEVATTSLDATDDLSAELNADPIAAAAAAIDAPAPNPQAIPEADEPVITPAAAVTPTTPTAPVAAKLAKPFIQVGIFSVESNAQGTADRMRAQGIIPTVYEQESAGKQFWRVVVGPMTSESDRAEVLKTVKSAGFTDAYFVTN